MINDLFMAMYHNHDKYSLAWLLLWVFILNRGCKGNTGLSLAFVTSFVILDYVIN